MDTDVQACPLCLSPLLNNLLVYSCGHVIHQSCHQSSVQNWFGTANNGNNRHQPQQSTFCCALCRSSLTATTDVTPISIDLYEQIKYSTRILNDSIVTSNQSEFVLPQLLNNFALYTNIDPTQLFKYRTQLHNSDHQHEKPSTPHPQPENLLGSLVFISTNPVHQFDHNPLPSPTAPMSTNNTTTINFNTVTSTNSTITITRTLPISTPLPSSRSSIFSSFPFQLDELSQPHHLINAILLIALSISKLQLSSLPKQQHQQRQQQPSAMVFYPTSSMLSNLKLVISTQMAHQATQRAQINLIRQQHKTFQSYLVFNEKQLRTQYFLLCQMLYTQLLPPQLQTSPICVQNGLLSQLIQLIHSHLTINTPLDPAFIDQVVTPHLSNNGDVLNSTLTEFDFQDIPSILTSPFQHSIFHQREAITATSYARLGLAAIDLTLSLSLGGHKSNLSNLSNPSNPSLLASFQTIEPDVIVIDDDVTGFNAYVTQQIHQPTKSVTPHQPQPISKAAFVTTTATTTSQYPKKYSKQLNTTSTASATSIINDASNHETLHNTFLLSSDGVKIPTAAPLVQPKQIRQPRKVAPIVEKDKSKKMTDQSPRVPLTFNYSLYNQYNHWLLLPIPPQPTPPLRVISINHLGAIDSDAFECNYDTLPKVQQALGNMNMIGNTNSEPGTYEDNDEMIITHYLKTLQQRQGLEMSHFHSPTQSQIEYFSYLLYPLPDRNEMHHQSQFHPQLGTIHGFTPQSHSYDYAIKSLIYHYYLLSTFGLSLTQLNKHIVDGETQGTNTMTSTSLNKQSPPPSVITIASISVTKFMYPNNNQVAAWKSTLGSQLDIKFNLNHTIADTLEFIYQVHNHFLSTKKNTPSNNIDVYSTFFQFSQVFQALPAQPAASRTFSDIRSAFGFNIGGSGFDTPDWVICLHLHFSNFAQDETSVVTNSKPSTTSSIHPLLTSFPFLLPTTSHNFTDIQQYVCFQTHFHYLRGFPHFHRPADSLLIRDYTTFSYLKSQQDNFNTPICTCLSFSGCECPIGQAFSDGLFLWAKNLSQFVMQQALQYSNSFRTNPQWYTPCEDINNPHPVSISSLSIQQLKAITLDNEIVTRLLPTHSHLALTLHAIGFGCICSHFTYQYILNDITQYTLMRSTSPQHQPLSPIGNYPANFLYINTSSSQLLDLVRVLTFACFVCLSPTVTEWISHSIVLTLSSREADDNLSIIDQLALYRASPMLKSLTDLTKKKKSKKKKLKKKDNMTDEQFQNFQVDGDQSYHNDQLDEDDSNINGKKAHPTLDDNNTDLYNFENFINGYETITALLEQTTTKMSSHHTPFINTSAAQETPHLNLEFVIYSLPAFFAPSYIPLDHYKFTQSSIIQSQQHLQQHSTFQLHYPNTNQPHPSLILNPQAASVLYRSVYNYSLRTSTFSQLSTYFSRGLILPQFLPATIHATFSLLLSKSPLLSTIQTITHHFQDSHQHLNTKRSTQPTSSSSLFTHHSSTLNQKHPQQQHQQRIDEMFSTSAYTLSLLISSILSQSMNSILLLLLPALNAFTDHWKTIFQTIQQNYRLSSKILKSYSQSSSFSPLYLPLKDDYLTSLARVHHEIHSNRTIHPSTTPPHASFNNLPVHFSTHAQAMRKTLSLIYHQHLEQLPTTTSAIHQLLTTIDAIPTIAEQFVYLIYFLRWSFQQSLPFQQFHNLPKPQSMSNLSMTDILQPSPPPIIPSVEPLDFIDAALANVSNLHLDRNVSQLVVTKLSKRLQERRRNRQGARG